MPKIFALLICCLILFKFSNAQEFSDCSKFKTGKFHNLEKGIVNSIIERTDSIQIEQNGDFLIKLKIEWIDDCSYRLVFLEGNDAWWQSRGVQRSTPDLIVRITDIEANSYLQEAKFVGDNVFKYKSNIVKVE